MCNYYKVSFLFLDDTLTVNNVCQTLLSVKDWHSLGCSGLEILSSVCDHIRGSLDYSTEEEKKRALIKYYLRTMPDVSWKGIATGLFRREEKAALKAVNDYLKDPKGEVCSNFFHPAPAFRVKSIVCCQFYLSFLIIIFLIYI